MVHTDRDRPRQYHAFSILTQQNTAALKLRAETRNLDMR